jgi:soluble lytic murein transglycosylase-like protein
VEAANPAAINVLVTEARAYEHGEGVPKDAAQAVKLYCAAARLGDAEAQFSLGWMYTNGRGVKRDDALASYMFRLAARQGNEHAQKMLRFVGEPMPGVPECLRDKQPEKQTFSQQTALRVPENAVDFVAVTETQRKAVELVNKLAPEYGVNPRLALAVIRAESNFEPLARSEKNAQGLMQLIPETAARFNVSKPFDPIQNVRGGLAYLRWLLAYFQGNVTLVAAAYNAGEGAVNRYRGIPPYPETRAYVKRIMEFFGRNDHPYDANVTDHSPVLSRVRTAIGF